MKSEDPGAGHGSSRRPAGVELFRPVSARAAVLLAGSLVAALGLVAFTPRLSVAGVREPLLGSAAIAAVWLGWLVSTRRGQLEGLVLIRRPHWVQILVQGSVYIYWGWYVDEVVEQAPLILVQVLFAYVLDLLMAWSRGRKWTLGIGPFPIVGSTNLFLWFEDPFFVWQLAMIALAYLSREYLRWSKEGRGGHIFNPSAFGLAAVSVVLIATQNTEMTWGPFIATTLIHAPHMYTWIFAGGLVVQLLFGVSLVTMAAAGSVVLFGLVWHQLTGDWYFENTTIPVAVFLGMHLLITDPVTSPRRNWGKLLFGVGYGLAVFPLYTWLLAIDTPSFYDKLLQVPLLNLLAPVIDRLTANWRMPGPWKDWSKAKVDLLHVGVWIAVFFAMRPLLIDHPGQKPGYWVPRCDAGDARACQNLRTLLENGCARGRAPACLELADRLREGRGLAKSDVGAVEVYLRACGLKSSRACAMAAVALESGVLGEPDPMRGRSLRARACDFGDDPACVALAGALMDGRGVPSDPAAAVTLLKDACARDLKSSCGVLGFVLERGQGVPVDRAGAREAYERACGLGLQPACARRDALR